MEEPFEVTKKIIKDYYDLEVSEVGTGIMIRFVPKEKVVVGCSGEIRKFPIMGAVVSKILHQKFPRRVFKWYPPLEKILTSSKDYKIVNVYITPEEALAEILNEFECCMSRSINIDFTSTARDYLLQEIARKIMDEKINMFYKSTRVY